MQTAPRGRPKTGAGNNVGARPQTARASSTHHGTSAYTPIAPNRPLTARINPPNVETPRMKRLSLANDAAVAQALNTHRSSAISTDQSIATTSRPDTTDATPLSAGYTDRKREGKAQHSHAKPDVKEVKQQVLRHLRMLAGHGDYIEREHAVNELCVLLQNQLISRSWIVDQGNLIENLVALAQMGTPGQKDGTAVLLCLLADSSASVKEAIVRVPKTIPALLRLLRGATEVQRVNAAATVWFLAENEEFRASVFDTDLFDFLVDCIDQGTSPQSEHASGALRMLAFENDRNALSTLQVERLPEILLNAAKSESHGESLQAVSLIAQLSSFETISFRFRSQYAALDDSLECLLRILACATDDRNRAGIEIKMQAAVCLRNLLTLPEVCELSRSITELVPTCITCFTRSEGMLRIRVLGALKTMASDEQMKNIIVRLFCTPLYLHSSCVIVARTNCCSH